jgi:hypothetical protein
MIVQETTDNQNYGNDFPAETPALMPLDGFETVYGADDGGSPLPFLIFGDEDEEEDMEDEDSFEEEEDFDDDDEFDDDDDEFDDDDDDFDDDEDDDDEDDDFDDDFDDDVDYNDVEE